MSTQQKIFDLEMIFVSLMSESNEANRWWIFVSFMKVANECNCPHVCAAVILLEIMLSETLCHGLYQFKHSIGVCEKSESRLASCIVFVFPSPVHVIVWWSEFGGDFLHFKHALSYCFYLIFAENHYCLNSRLVLDQARFSTELNSACAACAERLHYYFYVLCDACACMMMRKCCRWLFDELNSF